jgi:hypothetical protein
MTEETTKKQRSDAGKRRSLTNMQRREVFKLIEQNGAENGDWWQYSDGWSDERIAKLVDCGESQVASIRRDCFGDLKPNTANNHSPITVAFAEIKALKERVASLEAALARPASEDKTRLVLGGGLEKLPQVVGFHVAATKPNGA